MKGYIYNLWDSIETNIFYVGSTVNPKSRFYEHRRDLCKWDDTKQMYVRQYKTSIGMSIIEEVDFSERDYLYSLEEYWIYQLKAWGFDLINMYTPKYKKALI